MPRKCTICSHPQVKAIKNAICNGDSYRSIALNFNASVPAMYRHIETCLEMNLVAIVQEKAEQGAVDVHDQFKTLLEQGRMGLEAAAKSLTVDGKVDFNPRAWETEVVYSQYIGDLTVTKTAMLQDLLDEIQGNSDKIPKHTYLKLQDARKTYFDAISRVESLIDKFAKLSGSYTDPKNNPANAEITRLQELARERAKTSGMTYEQAIDEMIRVAGGTIKPEVRSVLEVKTVQ